MEGAGPKIFGKQSLITVVMPYYGYADQCSSLLNSLSKNVREIYQGQHEAFHRIFVKRELKCHYPLFERVLGALEKNYRYEQYKIWFQIKFPKDFPKLEQFIKDHPMIEFSHLHLVVTEESLESANSLIDTMRAQNMINQEYDDSYLFLDCSNYCRATEMKCNLRFETEMIVGAEPKAFIEKVDAIGEIDVRAVSRCPVEEIECPTHTIKADAEFATTFEAGEREIRPTFSTSVRRVIFEDEVDKVAPDMDKHIENVKRGFPNVESVWIDLKGEEVKGDNIKNMFANPEIHKIEYEGFEEENTYTITSKNIFIAIADGPAHSVYKVGEFEFEFDENSYETHGDYIVVNPSKINLSAKGIEHNVETTAYAGLASLEIDGKKVVIHRRFAHHLQLKSVPSVPIQFVPTEGLMMYLDEEKEEYEHINNYLRDHVSDSLPITLEVDMAFPENIDVCKEVVDSFFAKNVARVHIVMEMHNQDFIDHLYQKIKECATLKELQPIFHQDSAKVIDLVQNTPQVEQYIIDMRLPLEEQREDIKTLFREDKNNKFVLRDLHEWLLEFRFPTSFEVNPII